MRLHFRGPGDWLQDKLSVGRRPRIPSTAVASLPACEGGLIACLGEGTAFVLGEEVVLRFLRFAVGWEDGDVLGGSELVGVSLQIDVAPCSLNGQDSYRTVCGVES